MIRFELSDLAKQKLILFRLQKSSISGRLDFTSISQIRKHIMEHPSGYYSDGIFEGLSDSGDRSGTVQPEEDHEALHTAIQKLVNEIRESLEPIENFPRTSLPAKVVAHH